jgi:Xaa-Pro aminopeptidase
MTVTTAQLRISNAEFKTRCHQLLEATQADGLNGVVLFDTYYVQYYTGFAFIPTERPMAFVMNAKGEIALFVPRLEVEHAKASSIAERVDFYKEYPDQPHPMEVLAKTLADMGITGNIGVDEDGYPWAWGYRGAPLSKVANVMVTSVRAHVEDQMAIKSPAEIALIKESIVWGNLAHMLLQRYTKVGATETEVSRRASDEATLAMMDAIGPIYSAESALFTGAEAGYRGQIGRNAAIPHALANNLAFQPGDVLVTGAGAPVWGYLSELERTMVIGKPTDEQKRFFDHMLALQNTAFEAIQPGKRCADVDQAVRAYFEQHDLTQYWKHHSGHAIGLRYHEGPFLDIGDQTEIKPRMMFTVEPGLYVPGLGGFRHSDTVVVTGNGIEILTYYPRDLESLTLPI